MKKMQIKARILRAFLYKWRKLGAEDSTPTAPCGYCTWWAKSSCLCPEEPIHIPQDVPKGHLVVYVGEEYKRFVIRVAFLEHPLFRALLDQAREEYDFCHDSRLCIPCDEMSFVSIVRCVSSTQQNRRIWLRL